MFPVLKVIRVSIQRDGFSMPHRRKGQKNPYTYTKLMLANEIRYLLDMPIGRRYWESKPYIIVNAVIKAITEALLRGEKVQVMGFGTFRVKTHPPRRHYTNYFFYDKGRYTEILTLPPKKYVHFSPTRGLRNFVEEGCKDES